MSESPLSYELSNRVAILRMNDGKANALSHAMIDALLAALSRAEAEASSVVLIGRPERFSGGFDLKVMMSGPDAATALLKRGSELLLRLYGFSLPLVVACTGHALAGGALMVLTGDHRVGVEGAFKIGLNEVAIGLPVPILAMELARDRLVPNELHRATLLATLYNPAEALRAGYLDEVAASTDVEARALAEASRLGELSRNAFAATKKRLRGKTIAHIAATLDADVAELLAPPG